MVDTDQALVSSTRVGHKSYVNLAISPKACTASLFWEPKDLSDKTLKETVQSVNNFYTRRRPAHFKFEKIKQNYIGQF